MKLIANNQVGRIVEIAIHVLTWGYVFLSPILFRRTNDGVDWNHYFKFGFLPLSICISFYINYFILIPRYLLQQGRAKWFFVINALIIVLVQFFFEFVILPNWDLPAKIPMHSSIKSTALQTPYIVHKSLYVFRGFLIFAFAIGISVALRLSLQWRKSERARAEAEAKRMEAELKNLKNQINPHFLLNTLNNIYALTAFDQEKAQQAILQLSQMLRYMLYENQTARVSLSKEVAFLESYIALMKLRIDQNVDVQIRIDIPQNEDVPVAPLIFISLVENAFKHGISSTGHSYIHISLKATAHQLVFICENSNFPKSKSNDKAPEGIGLSQVRQLLDISYPGRYTWHAGSVADGRSYVSQISITD